MSLTRTYLCTLILLASLALAPISAHAVAILDGNIVLTEQSEVTVTFDGYDAGYTSQLFLDTPSSYVGALFTNKTAVVGSTITLGTFAAGTELVFRLFVENTGKNFFTGLASDNPDSALHAKAQLTGTKVSYGFEDLFNGGDKDYNDFLFSVNTRAVPDHAATAGLLALGLGALALARRRMR